MRRVVSLITLLFVGVIGNQVVGRAEFGGDERGTVNLGPVVSGGLVSQGGAAYGPPGIEARADTGSGQPVTVGSGSSGASDYTYRPIPNNQILIAPPLVAGNGGVTNLTQLGSRSACPPGQTGYLVYGPGGNGSFGGVCVAQPANSPERQLAQEASEKQPWPNLVLGINPGAGLTGLASWFWLGGGSIAMPDATATSGPLTINVHAALIGATWDFGDGSQYDSRDVGQAYPAASNVQHVYQTDTYGRPQGYRVSGILRFLVTYSVNGGTWQQLGVKTKAYSRSYSVFQLQPEAVSSQ